MIVALAGQFKQPLLLHCVSAYKQGILYCIIIHGLACVPENSQAKLHFINNSFNTLHDHNILNFV